MIPIFESAPLTPEREPPRIRMPAEFKPIVIRQATIFRDEDSAVQKANRLKPLRQRSINNP